MCICVQTRYAANVLCKRRLYNFRGPDPIARVANNFVRVRIYEANDVHNGRDIIYLIFIYKDNNDNIIRITAEKDRIARVFGNQTAVYCCSVCENIRMRVRNSDNKNYPNRQ